MPTDGPAQPAASDQSPFTQVHLAYYATELAQRATRPPPPDRARQLAAFIGRCSAVEAVRMLEVGCGGGRDGVLLRDAGFDYHGVDLTPEASDICADRGLRVTVASATQLPFDADAFDAAWTMSTLMHLDGDGFDRAVDELGRVVTSGGLVAVGVWGSQRPGRRVDEHGRLFVQRSDEQVRQALSRIGAVDSFETGMFHDDGGHYQFATVVVG